MWVDISGVLRWIDRGDHLSASTCNELVVNEQARGLLVLVTIWRCKINEEVSHFEFPGFSD